MAVDISWFLTKCSFLRYLLRIASASLTITIGLSDFLVFWATILCKVVIIPNSLTFSKLLKAFFSTCSMPEVWSFHLYKALRRASLTHLTESLRASLIRLSSWMALILSNATCSFHLLNASLGLLIAFFSSSLRVVAIGFPSPLILFVASLKVLVGILFKVFKSFCPWRSLLSLSFSVSLR
ncbi:unnamed protein product [Blepharisma stoltei]|uniref:Uncharacterized protein n=1 Tax=Blepharisma stoltei TaxID=1481888 RepID=A0AAU9IIS1_9CILI|nr:unnamed protein product [Blepharisma stoltei]